MIGIEEFFISNLEIAVYSWLFHFYPAALKGSGVLSYPSGRAGGRADKPR